jgi:hypothetical protein
LLQTAYIGAHDFGRSRLDVHREFQPLPLATGSNVRWT